MNKRQALLFVHDFIAVKSPHYLRMFSIYCRIKSVYLFFVAKMQFLVNILKK